MVIAFEDRPRLNMRAYCTLQCHKSLLTIERNILNSVSIIWWFIICQRATICWQYFLCPFIFATKCLRVLPRKASETLCISFTSPSHLKRKGERKVALYDWKLDQQKMSHCYSHLNIKYVPHSHSSFSCSILWMHIMVGIEIVLFHILNAFHAW